MTIDFSKTNEGDKVKFKSGGEAIVEAIMGKKKYHGTYELRFQGYDGDFKYSPNGKTGAIPSGLSPFDIVEIIEKPFDWNTVKNGMAFEYIIDGNPEPGLYYYIAPCLEPGRALTAAWFCSATNPETAKQWTLPAKYLIRKKQYDL